MQPLLDWSLDTPKRLTTHPSIKDHTKSWPQTFAISRWLRSYDDQCDQMARLFFDIWPLTLMKIGLITQSRFKIIPHAKRRFPHYQLLLKFGQSGEFWPNLVTVTMTDPNVLRQRNELNVRPEMNHIFRSMMTLSTLDCL